MNYAGVERRKKTRVMAPKKWSKGHKQDYRAELKKFTARARLQPSWKYERHDNNMRGIVARQIENRVSATRSQKARMIRQVRMYPGLFMGRPEHGKQFFAALQRVNRRNPRHRRILAGV